MSDLEQSGTVDGNTESPLEEKKTQKKARKWCMTLNNYTESEIKEILEQWNKEKAYMVQEEKGETEHLQGCVWMKNPRSLVSMKKINGRAHWEVCKNWKKSVKYCQKEESRNGKQWHKNVKSLYGARGKG